MNRKNKCVYEICAKYSKRHCYKKCKKYQILVKRLQCNECGENFEFRDFPNSPYRNEFKNIFEWDTKLFNLEDWKVNEKIFCPLCQGNPYISKEGKENAWLFEVIKDE